jgi:hypothetical protein
VARRINGFAVIEILAEAMLRKGLPVHIRSDNGPEMTAKAIRAACRFSWPLLTQPKRGPLSHAGLATESRS